MSQRDSGENFLPAWNSFKKDFQKIFSKQSNNNPGEEKIFMYIYEVYYLRASLQLKNWIIKISTKRGIFTKKNEKKPDLYNVIKENTNRRKKLRQSTVCYPILTYHLRSQSTHAIGQN